VSVIKKSFELRGWLPARHRSSCSRVHQGGELRLAIGLGAFPGRNGEHQVAHHRKSSRSPRISTVIGNVGAEFGEDRSRFDDRPRPIGLQLVPIRRQTKDRSGG